MQDWNRKNSPNPSNLLKQWRSIYLELPAQVIHRSTEGSLDVRGISRSKHLIRNHNLKEGYVNQGLNFLKVLHVRLTVSSSFCFQVLIQQNVAILSPYLSFRRCVGCK